MSENYSCTDNQSLIVDKNCVITELLSCYIASFLLSSIGYGLGFLVIWIVLFEVVAFRDMWNYNNDYKLTLHRLAVCSVSVIGFINGRSVLNMDCGIVISPHELKNNLKRDLLRITNLVKK